MGGGLIGFLVGIFAVIGAWLFGKANGTKTTTTKIGGEITIERQKRESAETKAEAVSQISEVVQEAVKSNASTQAFFDTAKTNADAIAIAKAQAERATIYMGEQK